ncbi:MAG: ABC transporter permease [Candidatus Omnitrophota bacterium]
MTMNKLAYAGAILIAGLVLVAVFAPVIAPHNPEQINIDDAYRAPSRVYPMGTDSLGRDVFSRIVYAARVALSVGIVAVGIASVMGILLGSAAGYIGGRTDEIIMRFTDLMLCFPSLFLILSVVAAVGPSILNIMVVIGLTSWMGIARLIRAEVLSLKTRDFVTASRALAKSELYIAVRHVIPNGMGPVLVNFVFKIAGAILTEAGLSFLGLGVQPPAPSWGNILMEGKAAMGAAWWIIVFPGAAILVTVLAFNLFGEGLRDALNPRITE